MCLAYAYKFEQASRLSPCVYLENVLTLLADVLVFAYVFRLTDA